MVYGIKILHGRSVVRKQLSPSLASVCPAMAIFSKKYYNDINELNHSKIYDYCFIGSINSNRQARQWVINFAKTHFTENSIFINTDNDPNWQVLGTFDKSKTNVGYCPKNMPDNQSKKVQYRVVSENIDYFEKMCQSKFVLCPAGDSTWSFRFYETLMCSSVPIVESWHHTYRTAEESRIKYKYILCTDIDDIKNNDKMINDYIDENRRIFESYHMLG